MRTFTIRTLLSSLVLSLLCVSLALAQEKTVEGTVTDGATGQPLPGANVSVKGTTTGTTSNMQGQYEMTVPGPNAVLVFSFVGYQQKEITVGDQTVIDVTLQEDIEQLDEVVVVGYGTQRRQEITGSVSSVDVAEANVGQNASAQDLIQGRIAGVNVIQNSGEPGAGAEIRVRGTSSISAGNEPLYVIDGVPINNTNITPGGASAGGVSSSSSSNPLALINPQDIESIQVLKDAAATAIYGSQGANGVVLIETKGGEAGSVQVDYTGKVTTSALANELDLLSGGEYRQAVQDVLGQSDTGADGNTDWQDEATRRAVTQEHNLSFSGGSESTTYRAALSYLDNQGIMEDTGIERVTGRVNADHSALNDRLRFGLNLTGSYLKRNHGFFNQGGGFEGGAIKGMVAFDPRLNVKDENGDFVEFARNIRNPIGLLNQVTDITDQNRILGNFSTEVDIIEDLTAKGTIGVDVQDGIRRTYIPNANAIGAEFGGMGRQAERMLSNVVTQGTLRYTRDVFDGQTLRILGGAEYKRETFQEVGLETRDFTSDATLFNNLQGGSEVQSPFSNKALVEQVSFFSRLNYNVLDKYFLTATVRRDGSSVFGDDEKFGIFPSASVGWSISNEEFMEDVDWLSQLKLRASFGITGNQAVPPYQSLPTLASSTGNSAIFGADNEVIGTTLDRAANPDLKWEETQEFNVGLDFTASRFDGSLEFFQRTTSDLLFDIDVLPPSPSPTRLENVGEVENLGVEATVDAFVIDSEDMSFTVGANISSIKNEITDLGGRAFLDHTLVNGAGQTNVNAQRLDEGRPIGSYHGPVFTGIDENGNETYRTSDGGTTTDLGSAEEAFIGNPIPDFSYGLSLRFRYQDFDLGAFFRGEEGKQLFNNTALEFHTKSNLGQSINLLQGALTDGTNSSHVPVYSSRWIEDASFFRLDKLTLGYTLPNASQYGMRRARVYVTGQNLFVITPYDGFDPEVNTNVNGVGLGFRNLALPTRGVDYTSFPKARSFTLGVEVGF